MKIDGVYYELDWRKFRKGTSFFLPCIDPGRARADLREVTMRLGVKTVSKISIVDGIRGLRVWRI